MRYLKLKQVLEEYPFTIGQLRKFILRRRENGFEKVLRKIGGRLYVVRGLLDEWIENQGVKK